MVLFAYDSRRKSCLGPKSPARSMTGGGSDMQATAPMKNGRRSNPFIPSWSEVGHPRRTDMRSVLDAIRCLAATGCQWALLPKDFPPFTTVHFYRMRDSGLLDLVDEAPVGAARLPAGREAGATAGVIDGRSVKPTEAAMTRARRSRAASAISSPIRVACRSRS